METKQKPAWLKKKLPKGSDFQRMQKLLKKSNLKTVCQEAKCPNIFECFCKGTATFLILGSKCTRNCMFCNVKHTKNPIAIDLDEPLRIAKTVFDLKLEYVVVTSVTRDDLCDGGALHFANTIKAIKNYTNKNLSDNLESCTSNSQNKNSSNVKVEVLIPDLRANFTALKTIINEKPDVLNHNIETIADLYPIAKHKANYQRSLNLLKKAKNLNPLMLVKSGIMVGLGENFDELEKTITDIFEHGCDILTIGQYLQPSKSLLKVQKYYTPKEFEMLEQKALKIGFKTIASGPFVRSSFKAKKLYQDALKS